MLLVQVYLLIHGVACLLERRTRDRKVASSNPGRSGAIIFFSRVDFVCNPSKSEWPDYAAVQAECGNLLGNELTHNSSGNTRSQSSQLAEPLWTDPGLKSWVSLRELISTLKHTHTHTHTHSHTHTHTHKRTGGGMNCRTFSQNPLTRGKSHHHLISEPPYCCNGITMSGHQDSWKMAIWNHSFMISSEIADIGHHWVLLLGNDHLTLTLLLLSYKKAVLGQPVISI